MRAHVLAGRSLPAVWVPSPETRDDREVIRLRLEVAAQRTRIKNQIHNLLKRWQVNRPDFFTKSGDWSKRTLGWLKNLGSGQIEGLKEGSRESLSSLVILYLSLSEQLSQLDRGVLRLSQHSRYANMFRKLQLLPGIGTLTAMTFLTELGNLDRFANRRQLAAYLGLAPASFESGKRDDRKGHITRQGPSRVRHMLCQAAWAGLRCSARWRQDYDRIKRGSKSRGKVAIVAMMRKLAVLMWQVARSPEWDQMITEIDRRKRQQRARRRKKTSVRAQQTGAVPFDSPSPRPDGVKAEVTARRTGLPRSPAKRRSTKQKEKLVVSE